MPFADLPVRFSAPVMTQPWDGLLDATKFGSRCHGQSPEVIVTDKKVVFPDDMSEGHACKSS